MSTYCGILEGVKTQIEDGLSESLIISTIENSREMKTTYHGPREIISLLNWLEMMCSSEQAKSAGVTSFRDAIFRSTAGSEG